MNIDLLRDEVRKAVGDKFAPEIKVIPDIHNDYMTGLFEAARKALK